MSRVLRLLAAAIVLSAVVPRVVEAAPEIPEILKTVKVAITGPQLSLGSAAPLTAAQWDAVEGLVTTAKIRKYVFSGQAGNDEALARLVKLDPESMQFFHGPFTEAGAAHLAAMKSLKHIGTSHAGVPTAKAAAALANHPSLESFASDGFGTHGMEHIASARNLREIVLQHGLSSDANVKLFERHPSLAKIWLWPNGPFGILTDAAIASLTTLPKLEDLKLDYSRFTYDGGLKHLKNVPNLKKLALGNCIVAEDDLAKLKADLPHVTISYVPMPPATRASFEAAEANRDMPPSLKKINARVFTQAHVDGMILAVSSTAALTPEQWAEVESLRTKIGIRAFGLAGNAGDDAAVGRLAACDPVMLQLTSSPVTDAGLAHVAGMKSLRGLHLTNCGGITPAAASIVTSHPAIDNLVLPPRWLSDPATLAAVLANPRLKVTALAQQQATDANCAVLAKHPGLEELSLSPGLATAGLTNAGLASLATLPKLKKLSLSSARFSWDGGLEHLAKLPALASLTLSNVVVPQADIDRLKAALPKTTQLTFTAMPAAQVTAFEKLEAARPAQP